MHRRHAVASKTRGHVKLRCLRELGCGLDGPEGPLRGDSLRQTVFAGLQVGLEMTTGSATDVLAVPVSAVEGRYQTGTVYLPTSDPASWKRSVARATAGKMVEVKEDSKANPNSPRLRRRITRTTPTARVTRAAGPWMGA